MKAGRGGLMSGILWDSGSIIDIDYTLGGASNYRSAMVDGLYGMFS